MGCRPAAGPLGLVIVVPIAEAGVPCDDLVDDGGKGTVAQFAAKRTEST